MDENPDRVEVGIIINTFGVKGEVKVMPLTDDPGNFSDFTRIFLSKSGENAVEENVVEYEVRKSRAHKKWAILRLKGIDSRDQAAKLKDYNVYILREELKELEEDTYYETDLEGMEVYSLKDELVGVIREILKTKANDVYRIEGEGGREILIPAIKDVVKEIDVEANRMVIDPILGLI
jgi:16S rRNA processing protein RimM